VVATGKAIATTLVNALKTVIDNFDTIVSTVKNLLELWVSFKVGVVSAEITSGLMLIASAFKAITSAAEGAAAAEAVATEGISALVGLAAGAATYAGMKVMESSAEKSLAANKKAAVATTRAEPMTPEAMAAHKKVAESLHMAAYKITKGIEPVYSTLKDAEKRLAFTEVWKQYGAADPLWRKEFERMAEESGIQLSEFFGTKTRTPGGPKKADVIIENARFDIKQAFAEGYDPDRIAAAFVEQIGSTALYPGQSGFAGAATGA
jgi:hypothetical protein